MCGLSHAASANFLEQFKSSEQFKTSEPFKSSVNFRASCPVVLIGVTHKRAPWHRFTIISYHKISMHMHSSCPSTKIIFDHVIKIPFELVLLSDSHTRLFVQKEMKQEFMTSGLKVI